MSVNSSGNLMGRHPVMQESRYASQTGRRVLSFLARALVLALISLAVLSGGALAHPPSDATMTYDESTGDLIVTITHQADDPATHFVKQVTVRQGDTVLVDTSYTNQPASSSFTYRYNLPKLKGSSGELRADVQCSLFGSRSGTLTLRPAPGTTTPGNAVPAAPLPGTTAPGSAVPAAPAPTKSPVWAGAALVAVGFVATRILR